ncbi:MAG: site-specific integrase [Bacteroidales bacterium]|nr:site-specific integrase [Bacteroidales bacterium]
MASAKFFLKDPKSKESTLIYLIFQFNYFEIVNGRKKFKFLKYSTGVKILPKFWNPKTHLARITDKYPEHGELNTRLKMIASIVEDEHRKVLNDGLRLTPFLLKERLKKRLGKSVPIAEKVDLFGFINQIIKDSQSGKRLTDDGKKFSSFTIKGYKTTLNHLIAFQKEYQRAIDFDTIDLDFYDDFVNFFNKNNYAVNSIGKHIKNLKVFMRAAGEKKLHSNVEYQNKRFKTIEEKTDSIYLNDAQIEKIYNLDLLNNLSLEKTRDLFVVGCYTGLRFSDYNKIVPENIKKNEKGTFLHVKTQKTNEKVVIPFKWVILEILKKYEGHIPKAYTNQEINRELKEIGALAEIDEKVSTSITKGGMRVNTVFNKYELITTHTARRSFATNMYLAGIPTISIMKITGHKTEKAFMRYIKISQEDNANKLIDHPYFSQQKPVTLKKI